MKRARTISLTVLVLAVLMMAVNWLVVPLPDLAVRTAGVAILLALAGVTYCTVKGSMER